MQRSKWQIIDYFHQFLFGFIYHDIERCIEAKANYVVALALLPYTEYIGGLISGNLGLKDKAKDNFDKALEYFPDEYRNINSTIQIESEDDKGNIKTDTGIYSLYRCGMVHEYFIKGFATIYNDPSGQTENHIGIVEAEPIINWPKEYNISPYKNKVLEFHTNEYFRDFKLAIDKMFKMLVIDNNQDLLKGFNKSLDRTYSRKIV